MRISDLHLKIGLPPLYRIDGKLVRLKGPPLTQELVEQLIYPLITDKNLAKFQNAYFHRSQIINLYCSDGRVTATQSHDALRKPPSSRPRRSRVERSGCEGNQVESESRCRDLARHDNASHVRCTIPNTAQKSAFTPLINV